MKIMHVMGDDKFIDMAIREFEAVAPGVHEYVIIDAVAPFHYVKSNMLRSLDEAEFARAMKREDIRGVVFHCIPINNYRLLSWIPPEKRVIWIGWGADYYDALLSKHFSEGMLFPQTKKIDCPSLTKAIYRYARQEPRKILRSLGVLPNPKTALRRVDYFSPVLDVEYHLACRYNSWFRPRHICWNYGTVEDDFTQTELVEARVGDNLLVGNSATPTNNHYETFLTIAETMDLTNRKVIVPLSYGDPEYRNGVVKLGRQLLGDSFVPLVDFMPIDQYTQVLSSCGLVLMNHIRQQGLGNIIISVIMGAKVFLNEYNPLYSWLKAKGVVIGNIAKLDSLPLTQSERFANAAAIRAHWGRDAQRGKTQQLVDIALFG